MKRRHDQSSRGIALLLVLAILAIVMTTLAAVASYAASVSFERRLDRATRLADDLERAAEPLVLTWLNEQSRSVVLPPDAASPEVGVLHHLWRIDGRSCELRITAWDQCGMVSLPSVHRGSPLRLGLPAPILRAIEGSDADLPTPIGLDLFARPHDPEDVVNPDVVSAYPLPASNQAVRFIQEDSAPVPHDEASSMPVAGERPATIGAHLATHQEADETNGDAPPRINVHTAPADLVEAALREAGRGGLEMILAAREEGRRTSVADLPSPRTSLDGRLIPAIVGSSDAWALRIDVRIDRVRKSWWSIYRQTGERESRNSSSSSGGWECVQRVRITN